MSHVPAFWKRLEARIALALARAEQALIALASVGNVVTFTNGLAIGPSGTVVLNAPSLTTRTGLARITAYATVSGGTAVATDSVTAVLLRDGTQISGAPEVVTALVAGSATAFLSLEWQDTVLLGSSHIWALQITVSNGSGHTIEIPVGGGSAGGLGAILVEERLT
jgi:hypothetical protein